MNYLKVLFVRTFPTSPSHSLISSVYGVVVTSQNGGDKTQHIATRGHYPRIGCEMLRIE